MPANQQYATNVPQTTLTGAINASATSLSVASSSGWPAVPFTAVLDIGNSTQEPVDVTAVVGTTWTVTRNIDGTVGFAHGIGATVTHADIGRDFREARTHMDATSGQHGITGSFVGTTDTQTLSNKILTAPTIGGLSGAVATPASRFAGMSTNGPPTGGTFAAGDLVFDTQWGFDWLCTVGGTPGTWVVSGLGMVNFGKTTLNGLSTKTITLPLSGTGYISSYRLYVCGQSSTAGTATNQVRLAFNAVVSNYFSQAMGIDNSLSTANWNAAGSGSSWQAGYIPNAGGNAGSVIIDLPFFGGLVQAPTILWTSSTGTSGVNTSTGVATGSGWQNSTPASATSVILSLLSGNFSSASFYQLYGIV